MKHTQSIFFNQDLGCYLIMEDLFVDGKRDE